MPKSPDSDLEAPLYPMDHDPAKPDMAREKKIAGDLWNMLVLHARRDISKGIMHPVILGLDTRWLKERSGVQPVISEFGRLKELGARHGLTFIFRYAEGDALAGMLEDERVKAGASYGDIIVIGDITILDEESSFLKLCGQGINDAALLAAVDNSRMGDRSAVRLFEMFLLALRLASGRDADTLDQTFIKIEGAKRLFIFTPIEPYGVEQFRKANDIMIKEIETKA